MCGCGISSHFPIYLFFSFQVALIKVDYVWFYFIFRSQISFLFMLRGHNRLYATF